MTRRKSRDGRVLPDNVSERADGRFIFRYQLYGKPQYIYDRNLNELKKKILQSKIDVASGMNHNLGKMTLNEWYPQYIDIYKRGNIKDSTMQNYLNYYKWYVKDYTIGRMPLKEINRSHMVSHLQQVADKKNLSKGSIKMLANILYNCMQQVLYDNAINVNPVTNIVKEIKAKPKHLREALSKEEVQVLLEFLKIEGKFQSIYFPAIGVGLSTGLRFGEMFGLTWSDIDFKNHLIDINHSINYRDRGNGHEFFITSPKTENGVRKIPMSADTERLFKMQKQYQHDMRIRNDITIDGFKNFVFTAKTGIPYTHEAIVRVVKLIVKRANEWEVDRAKENNRTPVVIKEHTPHWWRHTYATRLVENAVPYESMKILMGHSSIKTTIDVYAHISQDNLKRTRIDAENVMNIFE